MLDPLTIALAIYGGYQGYRSAKKAGASGAGRILGAAIGAYGGYNLGTGIGSLTNAGTAAGTNLGTAAVTEGVTQGIGAFNPYAAAADQFAETTLSNAVDPALTNALGTYNDLAPKGIAAYNPQFQQLEPSITNAAYNVPSGGTPSYGLEQMPDGSWSYTQAQVQPQVQQAAFDTKGYSILDSEANNQKLAQQLEADKLAEMYKYDAQKTGTQLAKSDSCKRSKTSR
jgi:hypothetical protein